MNVFKDFQWASTCVAAFSWLLCNLRIKHITSPRLRERTKSAASTCDRASLDLHTVTSSIYANAKEYTTQDDAALQATVSIVGNYSMTVCFSASVLCFAKQFASLEHYGSTRLTLARSTLKIPEGPWTRRKAIIRPGLLAPASGPGNWRAMMSLMTWWSSWMGCCPPTSPPRTSKELSEFLTLSDFLFDILCSTLQVYCIHFTLVYCV